MTVPELIKKYNYKPLPPELSKVQREQYTRELEPYFPSLKFGRDCELYVRGPLKISDGYNRIVVGDYGAYIEFSPSQAAIENFEVAPGQEYRLHDQYRNTVKYFWLCPKGVPDIKIYFQQQTVDYADYKPMMFYISPYDVMVRRKKND